MRSWIRLARVGTLACCVASPFQTGALAAEADSAVEEPSQVSPGQGIVAGTLVMDFQDSAPELRNVLIANSAMWLWIRRLNDPDAKDIGFSTRDRRAPGMTRSTSSDQRLLFARSVPAGDYEITYRGVGALTESAGERLTEGKMQFTVAPGVITYIGAEVATAHGGKDWIGVTHFRSANMSVVDDVADDGIQLYHARPTLRALPIRDALTGALLPAPGLDAEARGKPVSDDVPFRDVAGLKTSTSIGPAVFAKLEAFHPANAPASSGGLRRILLHRAATHDGKPAGGGGRALEFLPAAPGYVYDVTATSSGPVRMLQYMSFIPVRTRSTRRGEELTGMHFNTESSNSLRLNDVKLPDFGAATTVGATWVYEYEADTTTQTKTVLTSRTHSNFSIVKRDCRTGERQPASTLSPRLAGTMLSISCVSTDRSGDELTMAYLEDYGVFVPLRQTVAVLPKGQVVSEFSVVRVELAGDPVAPAVSASAASEPSDAE